MIRCSAVQLRQSESRAKRADSAYFDDVDRRIAKPQCLLSQGLSERNGSLSPDQLRAVGVLAGADPADVAGCGLEDVACWLDRDPEFIAGLNRAKNCRRERLRAENRSLTSEAVATLQELLSSSDVPPAVRLRACLATLEVANVMKAENIGPTSAEAVRARVSHQKLIES
jgi:hypothetical protein